MSEFKVGDRVITRWNDSLLWARALARDTVPEGEHVIIEISEGDARLDKPDGFWYPLRFMTKIDDAPAAKDDGGPAFPIGSGDMRDPQGMSLRDVCAMLAMQAFISGGDVRDNMFLSDPKGRELTQWLSEDSYAYADAMIKARKK